MKVCVIARCKNYQTIARRFVEMGYDGYNIDLRIPCHSKDINKTFHDFFDFLIVCDLVVVDTSDLGIDSERDLSHAIKLNKVICTLDEFERTFEDERKRATYRY